ELKAHNVPFVLVGRRHGVRSVAADDVAGGRLAAEHLLRLGHSQVLHVTGEPHSQAMGDRAAGFIHAYERAGAPRPTICYCDDLSALGAYRAVAQHLDTQPDAHHDAHPGAPHTAIFAATDEMANGVISALTDAGLRVPADVSVIGFDDMPEIGEGLTTIRQDIADIARTAVELLHE